MRKYLLYMMGKNIPRISLILLLIVSMTLVGVPRVRGAVTYISLNPMEYEAPAPGHSFTIDVNITDVTNLGVWEFKLAYNTTILDAVEVIYEGRITENNTDWLPINATGHWSPINDTLGVVWVGALFPWGQEFTGSGTLVTINFTATAVGDCDLDLYETTLGDEWGDPINHTALDGSVTVIPEFPAALVMSLLLVATLAAALLGKTVWSRKRKDAPIAE